MLLLGTSLAAIAASGAASPAQAQFSQVLDPITVVATKTEEKAIESLAAVSVRRQADFDQTMPVKPSDLFFGMPGVSFAERGDDPASAINIRGLQDFGRVAVVIDGARQNFQKSGHNANGAFYLEPELLSGVDVVRGPVANIYGSGAIGGVVSFQTKDVNDVLKPGERWGILGHGMIGTNQGQGLVSLFAAGRPNDNIDIFAGGTYRTHSAAEAGTNGGPIPGIAPLLGPGSEIPGSNYDITTGIAKVTVRPAEGHQIKVGGITLDATYTTFSGTPSATASQFQTTNRNNIVTAGWRYSKPDDNLFDWDANVYWTENNQHQLKTAGSNNTSTGNVGDTRDFHLATIGTDIHNTSRFVLGESRHAITLGVDAFRDEVKVVDPGGAQDSFTPSGNRSVYGGFVQWKANYRTWLEVIGALRYDAYELNGNGVGSSGDRLSPKITVGVTPIAGITPYVTYAEGYRAPALTETIADGGHPPFANFPGAPPGFVFVPNPTLRPEVGKTKEAGINLKFDNILMADDKFRGKFNVYRNDVDDYIDAVQFGPINFWGIPSFFQYQNVAQARLEGVELETMYDAGAWFLGVSASHVRGTNVATGMPLANIPADQIATTAGVRFWDRKVTVAVRWAAVASKKAGDIPDVDGDGAPDFIPVPAYNLVNLYIGYQPNENVLAGLSVENLLNEYYVRYPEIFPQAGITVKASLKVRLAGGA
jgi:hemoglobin/transferrin/lactoferrin receptor protein